MTGWTDGPKKAKPELRTGELTRGRQSESVAGPPAHLHKNVFAALQYFSAVPEPGKETAHDALDAECRNPLHNATQLVSEHISQY